MVRSNYRLRFRKLGDLRLVSHADLARCFTRMFRRAQLPVRFSEGFHPHPKLRIALSLALGVEGLDEVAEFELTDDLPVDEVHRRLTAQCPPGLEIVTVQQLAVGQSAQVRGVTYRVALPTDLAGEAPTRLASLLARTACWVERTNPRPRRIDVRPFLRAARLEAGPPPELEFDCWVTPHGGVRPEELLDLLEWKHLLDSGIVIRRTRVEVEDETLVAGAPDKPLPAVVTAPKGHA
jgi:radical SAM-linked protein